MGKLGAFMAAAVMVEALISYVNSIFVQKKVQWKVLVAIAIGIVLAFNLNLDLFDVIGVTEDLPAIGTLMTGIVISRGANYVYELYDKLTNWKRDTAE